MLRRNTRSVPFTIVLTMLLIQSGFATLTEASPPDRMAFQGLLRDDQGTPLVGPVALELRIYDALVGGSVLYAESHASVPLVSGVFDVALGTGALLAPNTTFSSSLFEAADRYVEIGVDGETMSPRQTLQSVPYALQAATAARIPNAGSCYTRWGANGCAAGFDEVLQGRTGGLEHYSGSIGVPTYSLECVDATAATEQSFTSTYWNRLFRGDAEGDGMSIVSNGCSTCCSGGCYTALGTTSCAAGYTQVYSGRAGGLEAYQAGHRAQTLCVDGSAPPVATFASGYATRLFRHREATSQAPNGMDVITNACAVCCR